MKELLHTLTDPKATFVYGLVLLLLFAAYVITGSERAKRILGTVLTIVLSAIAISSASILSAILSLSGSSS